MKMTYLALGKACAKCNLYPLLKITTSYKLVCRNRCDSDTRRHFLWTNPIEPEHRHGDMREFPGSTWPWMQILKRRGSALHWGDNWDHLPAHRGGGGGQWRGVRVPVCDDNLYLRGLTVTLVAWVLHHNWLLGAESGLPQTGSTSSVKTRLVEHVDQTSQPVTITLSNTIITLNKRLYNDKSATATLDIRSWINNENDDK